MTNTIANHDAGSTHSASGSGREAHVFDAVHAMVTPRNEALRVLPSRNRRMVGAWCFVDVFGPTELDGHAITGVPPHPHMGLQTVSWLVRGSILHRDSMGTTALIEPGRVAIMTAGQGIAHSENSSIDHGPVIHGAQLWVALPEHERMGEHSFTLYEPSPVYLTAGVRAKVFVGQMGSVVAPAQGLTPLLGVELSPTSPRTSTGRVPLEPNYEHVLVPLMGTIRVCDEEVQTGQAIYLGADRDNLDLELSPDARVLLLGGVPFEEEIVMWWNFVARTHEEVEEARGQWNAGDAPFGEVSHYPGSERLAAPPMPNVRLQPRGRRR